ncbi:hypothetical protein HMPREF9413_5161 [Paenibacillus sp. HGF7]|nr:hypothetical protein HMPREF9413_5161 [Paenibacillus sp. HGF7]
MMAAVEAGLCFSMQQSNSFTQALNRQLNVFRHVSVKV